MGAWDVTLIIACSIFVTARAANQGGNDCADEPFMTVKGESNTATLIGLFDIHEGPQCTTLRPGGFKQIHVPMWLADKGYDYIAYDTCRDVPKAIKRLVHGLNTEGYFKTKSCESSNIIGVLGPSDKEISHHVSYFLTSLGIPYFPIHITSLSVEIEAVVAILSELKWKQVALFFGEQTLEVEFFQHAKQAGICVSISNILPKHSWDDSSLIASLTKLDETSTEVVVVLGSDYDVHRLLKSVASANGTGYYWLFAGVSGDNSDITTFLDPMDPVMIIQRTFVSPTSLWYRLAEALFRINISSDYADAFKRYFNMTGQCGDTSNGTASISSKCYNDMRFTDPLVISTMQAVNSFVEGVLNKHDVVKRNVSEEEYDGIGANATRMGYNDTSSEHLGQLKDASSEDDHDEVKIWSYQHPIKKISGQKLFEVGQYRFGKLTLNMKELNLMQSMGSGWFRIPEFHCDHKCFSVCLNKANASSPSPALGDVRYYLHFRSATWLTVALTVSCMGGLLALILIIYLLTRMCHKGITLDSHHGFSIVTLTAILFSYACTLLFAFSSFQKGTRMVAVGLAHTFMLAPILSRCFMIIAADMDGIPGHVSGLIQSILCFFIAAVQIAITTCYWLFNPSITFTTHKSHVIGYLSYATFLGILWVMVSPFCARSHRGYREGLLIHIASVGVLIVWIIWILMFFLLSSRWQDMVLCIGLIATASVILLLVFLPRVYRMVTSTALDVAQVSLRPVALDVPSSQGHSTSIYESVNHGYNSDRDGFAVDMFRDNVDHPTNNKMTHL